MTAPAAPGATAPAAPGATAPGGPGSELPAGLLRALGSLADRAVVCDMYDERGAHLYDDLAAADSYELTEIVGAVRRTRGPILELAAGSGRLTVGLLQTGRAVTATDLSATMLELLGVRLQTLPSRLRERCTVLRADMREIDLPARYAAVVLGTASITLLGSEDRARVLRRVRAHLADDGVLLMTSLSRRASATTETEVTGGSGTRYRILEQWAGAQRTVAVVPARPPATGPVPVGTSTLQVLSLEQLSTELVDAGLAVRSTTEVGGGATHGTTLFQAVRR